MFILRIFKKFNRYLFIRILQSKITWPKIITYAMALSLIFIKNYFFSVRPNNKYSLNYSKFMGVNILFISLFENMNTELFEGNFKYKENNFHSVVITRLSYCLQIRDAYMLKIFEDNQTRLPSWCNSGDNKVSFCQILGEYQMELPQYNTLDPYANMNENCPSLPPHYERPRHCWIWTKLVCQCIPRKLPLLLFVKHVSGYLVYEHTLLVLQFLHEISIYVHSSCIL